MFDWLTAAYDWLAANETLAWWVAAGSLTLFVGTLIAVPVALVHLPQDYFVVEHRRDRASGRGHPLLNPVWTVGRNLLGVALLCLGIVMLVLPGQGIITILVGIMLLKFPGKHRLEHWLVSRQRVLRSVNWLRRRYRRQPLEV